jgi:hypothetical protein
MDRAMIGYSVRHSGSRQLGLGSTMEYENAIRNCEYLFLITNRTMVGPSCLWESSAARKEILLDTPQD